ncbi:MAG: hypothetical protein H0V00_17810 [Chloroflexia bacterium]|nr:hypothetical protein [Chloroflexia bacterium]
MDPHRFDSWTRALAAGLPRRTALKALLGVTLASGAARAAVRDVDAAGNFGDFCGAHDPCNSPLVCINTQCDNCLTSGTCQQGWCCAGCTCSGALCVKCSGAMSALDVQGCSSGGNGGGKKKKKKKGKKKKH